MKMQNNLTRGLSKVVPNGMKIIEHNVVGFSRKHFKFKFPRGLHRRAPLLNFFKKKEGTSDIKKIGNHWSTIPIYNIIYYMGYFIRFTVSV